MHCLVALSPHQFYHAQLHGHFAIDLFIATQIHLNTAGANLIMIHNKINGTGSSMLLVCGYQRMRNEVRD